MVFLNACHAARLLWDPRINRDVYGFARAFLQAGADVVIGPTGFVETELAGRIAAEVLDQVTRQPNQSLAEPSGLSHGEALFAQVDSGFRGAGL